MVTQAGILQNVHNIKLIRVNINVCKNLVVVVVVKTMLLAHTSFHAAMIALYMNLLSKHWDAQGKRCPDIHKIGPLII